MSMDDRMHIITETDEVINYTKPTLDKDQLSNYRPISNILHIQNSRTFVLSSLNWLITSILMVFSILISHAILQTTFHWNDPVVHSLSPNECHWITEVFYHVFARYKCL